MGEKNILNKSESFLKARKICIERMDYKRKNISGGMIKFTEINIGKEIVDLGSDSYKCSVLLELHDEDDNAELHIVVSGIFEIDTEVDSPLKEVVVTKNTIAILFPYLRSQVTLMTAQPDIEPVVLPPVNINTLLKYMENAAED